MEPYLSSFRALTTCTGIYLSLPSTFYLLTFWNKVRCACCCKVGDPGTARDKRSTGFGTRLSDRGQARLLLACDRLVFVVASSRHDRSVGMPLKRSSL